MSGIPGSRRYGRSVVIITLLLALFLLTGAGAYRLGLRCYPALWGETGANPLGFFFPEPRWAVADEPLPLAALPPLTSIFFSEGDLLCTNAYLLRLSDSGVLLDYDAGARVFPASLTKIMTALVVIESGLDLDKPIVISAETLQRLAAQDASTAGFLAGESVRARDLLYGALLSSGAECSEALALETAGSLSEFVQMMNTTAYRLGLTNTNFTNPTGLHSDDQFSSARDIAELLRYALENEIFRSIFLTPEYISAPTNLRPQGLALQNRVTRYLDAALLPEIFGCKTGYTRQAGICLASYSALGGEEYILVTLGAPRDAEDAYFRDLNFVYQRIR
ncbi:MAG: serine hydrolase [Gracilibacteraceae bacterium]|jgi:D-alanyl-D-alanine carboxypeptidase (penicillin-binding protein 5/6)|nr:serine hydrolase [Gracilibacteraceae bacterium]